MREFKRKILLGIKLYIFDLSRPLLNLYNFFTNLTPYKKKFLQLFGGFVAQDAKIKGKVFIWEPAWVQINRGTEIYHLEVYKNKSCYIGENVKADALFISEDSFITKDKIYTGNDNERKVVTFSLDLEGGVGLSHVAKKEWQYMRQYWDSKKSAEKIRDLLIKYKIPAVWGVCGHLFLKECVGNHGFYEKEWYGDWFQYDPKTNFKENSAWYMPDLIDELIENKLFEVGYHSFGHFNYFYASEQTIQKDLFLADIIRKKKKIKLETLIFPYNALGYLENVIQSGFKSLRGYVGQYDQYKTIDFGDFKFFYTSECLADYSVKKSVESMDKIIGKNFNYFTHPFSWSTEKGFADLEMFFAKLAELRDKGQIEIKLFKEI